MTTKCCICGGIMRGRNKAISVAWGEEGPTINVVISAWDCPNCGEIVINSKYVETLKNKAMEAYNEKYSTNV